MTNIDVTNEVNLHTKPSNSRSPLQRLLLVAARCFPYTGGVETHVFEVGKRLVQAGIHVTVLSTDPIGHLPKEQFLEGMHILRVRSWPAHADYYFAPDLYRIITQGNWDIVNCVGYHNFVAPLTMLAASHVGMPYIVTLQSGGHSSRLRNALRRLHWRSIRPLLAKAECIIAISEFEAEFFQKRLGLPSRQFTIIPNGTDLPAVSTESSAPSNEYLILSIGRLERYKGHHRVIKAMPHVLAVCPRARLRIVGKGSYEPSLRRLIAKLGLGDHVEIASVQGVDRQGMATLIQQAKLVTLLSDYESQGIAAMEALSLGCPVLVSDTTALRELAQRGYASSVALHAPPVDIAHAILDRLFHPPTAMTIELPSWDACATQMLSIYQHILAGE